MGKFEEFRPRSHSAEVHRRDVRIRKAASRLLDLYEDQEPLATVILRVDFELEGDRLKEALETWREHAKRR